MAMLLIPGFMLDADLWRDVEPALAEFGPVRHADLSQDGAVDDMARRALAEAPEKFALTGFSMGGYVARQIARQAPERVTALILIATSARGDSDVQVQRKAAIAAQDGTAVFKGLSTSAVASSLHPDNVTRMDLIGRVQAMGQRLGAEVFHRQSLLDRRDERDDLHQIRCPALVIAGEKDRLRSRAEAIELHHGLAGSSLEIVENTGHMIPLEAPDALAQVMADWLRPQQLASQGAIAGKAPR
ncbi:alpha/beta hydrolase [Rhizobium sp. TRM96647]|uniref:alpha/beta fold hydrolase n=1 Tax=unclassified Rhizobium TaxID=2613769 RepID=UPI0021E9734D|nr:MULTISPECIES: alpha/beta hydrolase [unclassified Rhizobium]MCV3737649.1 alpha/beta hydrolase [Rhizobium sp. TRM96647]MCV3759620.1 alpha/beta hydrolase [Rhizobium sp. TRM96650]